MLLTSSLLIYDDKQLSSTVLSLNSSVEPAEICEVFVVLDSANLPPFKLLWCLYFLRTAEVLRALKSLKPRVPRDLGRLDPSTCSAM
jgi:hypothetical protein